MGYSRVTGFLFAANCLAYCHYTNSANGGAYVIAK